MSRTFTAASADSPAVHDALESASRYAPVPVSAVRALMHTPWRVAVIGRTGVGKTTLINQIAGSAHRTGLGGVTQSAVDVPVDGFVLVDTAGIDGRARAIDRLAPVVDACDAVLWVVDGLQPATRTERDVIATVCWPDQPIAAVVSRVDLIDPAERGAILARVARATKDVAPQAADLRSWTDGLPDRVRPRADRPRIRRALIAALAQATAVLESTPEPPNRAGHREALRSAWREAVQGCVRQVLLRTGPGDVEDDVGAVRMLKRGAAQAHEAVLQIVLADPARSEAHTRRPLLLPDPPDLEGGALSRVAGAMGGVERARHRLREVAGRWLLEGEMSLADWVTASDELDTRRSQYRADRAAMGSAREQLGALPPVVSPP